MDTIAGRLADTNGTILALLNNRNLPLIDSYQESWESYEDQAIARSKSTEDSAPPTLRHRRTWQRKVQNYYLAAKIGK